MTLGDKAVRIGSVLRDAMGVDEVERSIGKRQMLAVRHSQIGREPLLGEVRLRKRDGRRSEIDAGHLGASLREARQIDAGAAADFEHRPASIAVEVDEPQQVVELFEVVLVEIVEESTRADRMTRDLEVVDVPFPVVAHLGERRHATILSLTLLRDLSQLSGRTFDLLVVGGGIYGLTIAYDAAQRGLSVALVERGDFGSGSSFNHLRTIHGGLRYLQSLDLRRARESAGERRALARIAPHGVRPLPFVLPLFRSLTRGPLVMRTGLLLDRAISCDRNTGIVRELRLPPGRVIGGSEAIARFPALQRRGLKGAALWYDYVLPEADRLTFAWAEAAVRHGATLANHVGAAELLVDKGRVVGARAADCRTGDAFEIGARMTINATGPAVDRLLTPLGIATRIPLLQAMNLVTRRDAGDEALAGRAADGRHLFLVPWRNRALFGTWESTVPSNHRGTRVDEGDVARFVAALNGVFPGLDLQTPEVSLVHSGLVPAFIRPDGSHRLAAGDQIVDHRSQGVDGLITVVGTKYTTARAVAERIVDRVLSTLGRARVPCRTDTTPLPGGDLGGTAAAVADGRRDYDELVPSATIPHLVAAYGSRFSQVLALAATRADWRLRVADDSPVIGAELVWAVRHEMAVTLADAAIRRTPLGALGHPGDVAAARAASIVGSELGWSEERRQQELRDLRADYEDRSL